MQFPLDYKSQKPDHAPLSLASHSSKFRTLWFVSVNYYLVIQKYYCVYRANATQFTWLYLLAILRLKSPWIPVLNTNPET